MKYSATSIFFSSLVAGFLLNKFITSEDRHYSQYAQTIKGMVKSLQDTQNDLMKQIHSYEDSENLKQGKIFSKDFESYFNVVILSENIADEGEEEHIANENAFETNRYLEAPEGNNDLIELYSLYGKETRSLKQVYVKWAGPEMGYGVFANMPLPAYSYIGEYTGILTRNNVNTDYTWNYPTKFYLNYWGLDSRYSGNILRFVNDVKPELLNCETVYFIRNGKWVVGYRTTKYIRKDEQLFVSYGDGYWAVRRRHDPK